MHYNHYALCTSHPLLIHIVPLKHVFATLIHCLAASYNGTNPKIMYSNQECFARDSNQAKAPRMVQQSGALSITPFRLPKLPQILQTDI